MVTDPVGNRGRANFKLVIEERSLSFALPSTLTVYRGFDYLPPITTDGTGLTYRYTGLPSGLTFSAGTGALLTARTPPAAGTYAVVAIATDAFGTTVSSSFSLVVGNVPPTRLTPWVGVLARNPLNNQNLGASFTLKPAASGLVTGKLMLGGVRYAFSGRMRTAEGAPMQATLIGTARGRSPLTLTVELPADGSAGSGTLTPSSSTPVALEVWPAPYNRKNPATGAQSHSHLARIPRHF